MNTFSKHLSLYRYAYLWGLVVLVLCGMNGASLPHFDVRLLIRIDKIAHLFLFGFECYLIAAVRKKQMPEATATHIIFPAFAISVAYGILIEILQAHVFINRSYDVLDMLANTIGCVLAWVWMSLMFRKTTTR